METERGEGRKKRESLASPPPGRPATVPSLSAIEPADLQAALRALSVPADPSPALSSSAGTCSHCGAHPSLPAHIAEALARVSSSPPQPHPPPLPNLERAHRHARARTHKHARARVACRGGRRPAAGGIDPSILRPPCLRSGDAGRRLRLHACGRVSWDRSWGIGK
jgi:hypothetical protein